MTTGHAAQHPPGDVWERFVRAEVAVFATAGPTGPRLVPITFAWWDGRLVWAVDDVKPKRTRQLRRLRDLEAEPRVAVLVHRYSQDWSELWWVELQGTARVLGRPDEQPALAELARRYPAYRRSRPPGPVVAVLPERWTWWPA